MPVRTSVLFFLSLLAPACSRVRAGDDHDHPPQGAESELAPEAHTHFGARTLLYLEHPPLVRGEATRFLAHFSVLADGEPVRAGRVRLTLGGQSFEAAAPKRDGLFVPEGTPAAAGTLAGELVLEDERGSERFELGPLTVHPDAAAARAAARDEEDPPGAVPFLLEQQWRVKLLLAEVGPRTLVRTISVPAELGTPEDAQAVVSASAGGRLVPATGLHLPVSGSPVAAGELLGFVEVPLGVAELAALEALGAELQLESLALARELNEAELELGAAEREVERQRGVLAGGLGTRQELELAETSASKARARRAGLTRARDELALLRSTLGRNSSLRLPLTAPLAGRLVEVGAVAGETVAAGAPLFRIVAPGRFRVEGKLGEHELGVARLERAELTLLALPGRRWSLGQAGASPFLAPELDPLTRTRRVRYELADQDPRLCAGLAGELAFPVDEVAAAVAIPRAALVFEAGQASAYVLLAGELFQRRDLELGLEAADFVEVRAGLAAGERVATRGAWLVKLASAAPASFGHGHEH